MVFKPVVTLGTLLVLMGMLVSVGTIIWQASSIAATVQANIVAQRELADVQNKSLHAEIGEVRADMRNLAQLIVTSKGK